VAARLIDGSALAARLREHIGEEAEALAAAGRRPGLAVLLVGEDPASAVYVRNKVRACAAHGLHSVLDRLPDSLAEHELLDRIAELNADPAIHGILVQMPLPRQIDARKVIAAIDPAKDVDGYSIQAAGELASGLPGLRPCTPLGCMKLIESTGVPLAGAHAVVIGRSHTVGKPMALMLLEADATVTLCHSRTPDLGAFTRRADVVVAAVGRRGTLTAPMVKPGAVVIDVGINRVPPGEAGAGGLCGDVEFDTVREVAGWITPVPGGVGPMTITMLLANTIDAARAQQRRLARA
jgi:methylenetetrahydrofolate dehydrogenase (NADP+)/methenyltetrahydrofolate cyclohydrolase